MARFGCSGGNWVIFCEGSETYCYPKLVDMGGGARIRVMYSCVNLMYGFPF